MGVDHRGADIIMSKQFLNRSDVIPVFEQMCCKRMPQRMATGRFANSRFSARIFHGCRKHSVSIFVAFAGTNNDLVTRNIDILHSETAAFPQPQSATVKEQSHYPRSTVDISEDLCNFLFCEQHGESQWS